MKNISKKIRKYLILKLFQFVFFIREKITNNDHEYKEFTNCLYNELCKSGIDIEKFIEFLDEK